MLNLNDAIRLYYLLSPYLPDKEIKQSIDFVDIIIENIKNGDRPRDYADAIMLMHNITLEELKEYNTDEILGLFIEGLAKNKIFALAKFMESLGSDARTSR